MSVGSLASELPPPRASGTVRSVPTRPGRQLPARPARCVYFVLLRDWLVLGADTWYAHLHSAPSHMPACLHLRRLCHPPSDLSSLQVPGQLARLLTIAPELVYALASGTSAAPQKV